MVVSIGIQGLAYHCHSAIHHVRRSYYVSAGLSVNQGHLSQQLARGVVVHLPLCVKDSTMTEALGSYITKNMVDLKLKEFEDYTAFTGKNWQDSRSEITKWEIERYLVPC